MSVQGGSVRGSTYRAPATLLSIPYKGTPCPPSPHHTGTPSSHLMYAQLGPHSLPLPRNVQTFSLYSAYINSTEIPYCFYYLSRCMQTFFTQCRPATRFNSFYPSEELRLNADEILKKLLNAQSTFRALLKLAIDRQEARPHISGH